MGRLEDILENIIRIERFTAGMDFVTFAAAEQTFYATIHALLIISEAARKLGDEANALVPGNRGQAFAASEMVCVMNTTPSIRQPSGG